MSSTADGKPTFSLTAADRTLVGRAVVYRLTPYAPPKLGRLVMRNPYNDWVIGAWVVRDEVDHRLYVLGTYRLAEQADLNRYAKRFKHAVVRSTSVEAVSREQFNAAPATVKKKREAMTMSENAAQAVEEELERSDG